MIVFHGSPIRGLKQLTYTEENSRFGGDDGLIHGAAIYMTFSENEAKDYAMGGSCYKINITSEVFDATDKEVLINFIKSFAIQYNINPSQLLDNPLIQYVIDNTSNGKSSGIMFARNIDVIITNDESLYSIITDHFDSDSDKLTEALEKSFQYKLIKLNHREHTWLLCLDPDGSGIEILEETEIND